MNTWDSLPSSEKWRITEASLALARLSWEYACPIIIAEADEPDDASSTASGFLIELGGRVYLATADHVVAEYAARRERTRYVYIQAGMLGIDALDRIVFRDSARDVAFVSLAGLDVSQASARVYQPIGPWPPQPPQPEDAVQFCGFPKAFRVRPNKGEVDFGALPGFGVVQTAGPGYCTVVIEREHVQVFGQSPRVLPPAAQFGGLSGGPVMLFGQLAYPVIGVISEVSEQFDIMRFATFDGLPPELVEAA